MIEIREPKNEREFEELYDLRWRIMRKPWKQPKGSERDELEEQSWNAIALDGRKMVGTARLHKNSEEEGQIRFMCVEEEYREKGIGEKMLNYLQEKARELGLKRMVANVRENAKEFYLKRGYVVTGKAHTLFGEIPHVKMEKKMEK